jgi:hypothetical protein
MCLQCSWKDFDDQDLMKDFFDKIWIQNVGNIDFEVTFVTENSNNFFKTRFWKENSVEDVVTLGPTDTSLH